MMKWIKDSVEKEVESHKNKLFFFPQLEAHHFSNKLQPVFL